MSVPCGTRSPGDQEGRFVVRFIFGGWGEAGYEDSEVTPVRSAHLAVVILMPCVSMPAIQTASALEAELLEEGG